MTRGVKSRIQFVGPEQLLLCLDVVFLISHRGENREDLMEQVWTFVEDAVANGLVTGTTNAELDSIQGQVYDLDEPEPQPDEVSDTRKVLLRASGYDWSCPLCDEWNHSIGPRQRVKCRTCGEILEVEGVAHVDREPD